MFKKIGILLCGFFLTLFVVDSFSQNAYLPLNSSRFSIYEKDLYSLNSKVHTAVRPIRRSELKSVLRIDSSLHIKTKNSFSDKILNGHLVHVKKKQFEMSVDPIINAIGRHYLDINKSGYVLSNGLSVNSSYRKKLFFSANYMYADASYEGYYLSYILKNDVTPSTGRVNRYKDRYFNQYFDGYLSYSPNRNFNFEIGQGRNFIGDGYRSLILSDNAFNYPYFKITTSIWKIKYMNLYAMQFDIRNSNRSVSSFEKKYTSSHYLSTRIGKRFTVGLFETVVWRGQDSLYNRSFDVNYLNPVIFLRPVEFSVGSPDNVLIGLNLSYKLANRTNLYGQVIIDEFLLNELRADNGWWANKYGFQFGFKSFYKKFIFQGEYNFVRPFTYSHSSITQNYAHFNQPLAHPLGANFKEVVGIMRLVNNRTLYSLKVNVASYGDGFLENVGQDVYQSNSTRVGDFGHFTGQGIKNKTIFFDLNIAYLLNPSNGLMIEGGIQNRSNDQDIETSISMYYLGIKTGIFNRYVDF